MSHKITVTLIGGPYDGRKVEVDAGAVPLELTFDRELTPFDPLPAIAYRRQLEDNATLTYRYVGPLKRGGRR